MRSDRRCEATHIQARPGWPVRADTPPRGVSDDASANKLSEAVDGVLEEHAAGFADQLVDEPVQRPSDLEASDADANLHSGAVNGGTSELYQQRIVRPMPGFGRAETPVENLYLGKLRRHFGRRRVHGVCGRNPVRAALPSERTWLAATSAQPNSSVLDNR